MSDNMKTQKTHFADNDTLKYIADLERRLSEALGALTRLLTAAENIGGEHVTGWQSLLDACVTAEKVTLGIKEQK